MLPFAKITCILAVMVHLGLQSSLPEDQFYKAGVVEFRAANNNLTPQERVEKNLDKYLQIISLKVDIEPDIIIFPESTLNSNEEATFVPDPSTNIIVPCDDDKNIYHKLLVSISCQAKRYTKYIVINLFEKVQCPDHPDDKRPCASNGLNIYNTNVVFDRNGAVISRYRKVHLYGEPRNTTYFPETGIFDTDFGVRFGHFICFDILFYAPAQELVDKYQISDFIFPSMWFSQLPFLTGVQFQHSWAFGNNVNLLTAGSNKPEVGSSGTGIYNGRHGSVVAVMNNLLYNASAKQPWTISHNVEDGRLIIGRIPKFIKRNRFNRNIRTQEKNENIKRISEFVNQTMFMKRDYLENYESEILYLGKGNSLKHEICSKTFCCSFDLAWKNITNVTGGSQYYTYRLSAYDGSRNEAGVEMNYIRNCALFSCISDNIMDCGKLFPATITSVIEPQVVFTRLSIDVQYPHSDEFLLMPNSLKEDLFPLEPSQIEWKEQRDGDFYKIRYSVNGEFSNILTFATYGNYYDDKGTAQCKIDEKGHCERGAAAVSPINVWLTLTTLLIGFLYL